MDYVYGIWSSYHHKEPKIVAAKVVKRTAKQVVIEYPPGTGSAFGYRTHLPVEGVSATPKEAAQAYLALCRKHTDVARATLDGCRQDEQAADKLLTEIENGASPPPHDTIG